MDRIHSSTSSFFSSVSSFRLQGSLLDGTERVQDTLRRPNAPSVRFASVDLGVTPMDAYASAVWESGANPFDATPEDQSAPETKEARYAAVATHGGPALVRSADGPFHIASMQFALHYMFHTRAKARMFFRDVASWLVDGGQFIATTVDARVVVEMLMQRGGWEDDEEVDGEADEADGGDDGDEEE